MNDGCRRGSRTPAASRSDQPPCSTSRKTTPHPAGESPWDLRRLSLTGRYSLHLPCRPASWTPIETEARRPCVCTIAAQHRQRRLARVGRLGANERPDGSSADDQIRKVQFEVSALTKGSNTKDPQAVYLGVRGGAKENRTPDLFHAMEALYQLSYSPEASATIPTRRSESQRSGISRCRSAPPRRRARRSRHANRPSARRCTAARSRRNP